MKTMRTPQAEIMEFLAALGERIRQERLKRGFDFMQAYRLTGISPTSWARMESGQYLNIAKIMLALRIFGLTLKVEEL